MTVALVLADEADAGLRGQLAALGVHQVGAAERTGPGLLTVAAAARAAGECVLVCDGDDAVPEEILVRLLRAGGTAAFTGLRAPAPRTALSCETPAARSGGGALVVDTPDLDALAGAAESLAAAPVAPAAVGALLGELTRRGVIIQVLDAGPDGEGVVAHQIIDPAARDMASGRPRARSARPRSTASHSAWACWPPSGLPISRPGRRSWRA